MADEDDVKDPPIEGVAPVEEKKEDEKGEVSADAGIASLKAQLLESEKRALAAEEKARAADNRALLAGKKAEDGDLSIVSQALDAAQRDAAIAENDLAAAFAVGDFKLAAKINSYIGKAQAEILQLSNGKAALEERAKNPVQPKFDNAVEAMASTFSPKSAAWLRKHPEFATDPNLTKKMIANHNRAVAEDFIPDSSAYFDIIEKRLGLKGKPSAKVDDDEGGEDESPLSAAATEAKPVTPPSAPPSSISGGSGNSKNSMRLTAQQIEFAESIGEKPEDYAKNLALLKKEKRLN